MVHCKRGGGATLYQNMIVSKNIIHKITTLVFCLYRLNYQIFLTLEPYSKFEINRNLVYSIFGLERFYCIMF